MTDDESTENEEVSGEDSGSVNKLSDDFQNSATELIEDCNTVSELDFIISLATSTKKKLTSAQNKSGESTNMFSTDDMPKD